MAEKMPDAAIIKILERAVDKIGAKILVEPEWGRVGQITYASGIRRYFKVSTLDLNSMGASEIARDKGFTRFFLKKMGYPVAEGKTFFEPKYARRLQITDRGLNDAWRYAQSIHCPVFVKPNSRSRGVGVAKVRTRKEFFRAASAAMRYDEVILVEKEIIGRDYRLVVLDGEVISAYERSPLSIIGDGRSSISDIVKHKYDDFIKNDRKSSFSVDDHRIRTNLDRLKLGPESILESGREIRLLDIANLSSGGTSIDVTKDAHPEFKRLAGRIAYDMGLRLVGVDLIIDGEISGTICTNEFHVVEVNSAPGLDHYAAMGEQQKLTVDALYLKVVTAMERPHEGEWPKTR